MDNSHHNKLFSPASEFYQAKGTRIPDSVRIDLNSAMRGLTAIAQSKKPSTPRPGRQFLRQSIPQTKSRSPSPNDSLPSSPGTIERREMDALWKLEAEFDTYYSKIHHTDLAALSVHPQCAALDDVTNWLQKGLALVETYEERSKYRKRRLTSSESAMKNRRDRLQKRMRSLHAEVYALHRPLIPDQPIKVDAGEEILDRFTYHANGSQNICTLPHIVKWINLTKSLFFWR